jgi:hypothetical protein
MIKYFWNCHFYLQYDHLGADQPWFGVGRSWHGCSAFVIVAWMAMACNLDQEFGSATATTDPVELRIASGEFYNSQ